MLSRLTNRARCEFHRMGQWERRSGALEMRTPFATAATEFKQQQQQQQQQQQREAETLNHARPFSEVPGPSKLQFLRRFLPGGRYKKLDMFELMTDMSKEYGQLFCMPGMFGHKDIVMTMNPADYELIFRNEGTNPYRRSFDSFIHYREVVNPKAFEGYGGLVSTNGEQWSKMRTAVNPILLQPRNARLYLNTLQAVNDEFLQRIREVRDPGTLEMPADFEEDIKRLVLESIGGVALNTRLGLLTKNRDSAESKTILDCMRRFAQIGFELEIMPAIWKYVKTPKFKEMMQLLDTLTNFCTKYIQEAFVRIEHDQQGQFTSELGQEKSVLEKLARINRQMAIVMATDLLIAGVDTTTVSLSGILVSLAKSPAKQEKLLAELQQVLPTKDDTLSMDNMGNLPYLRACIKEGIRLHPIGPGTMRRMPHDVVLSGYRIPAGTDVTMGANLQMWQEPYVPRAKEFLPERWLRTDNSELVGDLDTPFMYLPFGFGPRSCAGKRIVDLLLELAVARLVRNFHIEFNHSLDGAFQGKFFVSANVPLRFKFEERAA